MSGGAMVRPTFFLFFPPPDSASFPLRPVLGHSFFLRHLLRASFSTTEASSFSHSFLLFLRASFLPFRCPCSLTAPSPISLSLLARLYLIDPLFLHTAFSPYAYSAPYVPLVKCDVASFRHIAVLRYPLPPVFLPFPASLSRSNPSF